MATKKENYDLAVKRAQSDRKSVTPCKTFAETGRNTIRSLDLSPFQEGEIAYFPAKLDIFKVKVGNGLGAKCLTVDGRDFWVSVLTRGAKPLEGGDYVKPQGSAVETAQKYSDFDTFFKKEITEKKQGIKFVSFERITAKGYTEEEPEIEIKVWTLDLVPEETED